MRAEANEFEDIGIEFAVDQDQVRADVQVTAVFQIANKWMVLKTYRQFRIRSQQIDYEV